MSHKIVVTNSLNTFSFGLKTSVLRAGRVSVEAILLNQNTPISVLN